MPFDETQSPSTRHCTHWPAITSQAGLATPQSLLLTHIEQRFVTGEHRGRAAAQSALLRQAMQTFSAASQCGAAGVHWASLLHAATQTKVDGSQLWPVPQSVAVAHCPQRPAAATHTGPARLPAQSVLLAHCKQPMPGEQPSGQRPGLALHAPAAEPWLQAERPRPQTAAKTAAHAIAQDRFMA